MPLPSVSAGRPYPARRPFLCADTFTAPGGTAFVLFGHALADGFGICTRRLDPPAPQLQNFRLQPPHPLRATARLGHLDGQGSLVWIGVPCGR